MTDREKAIVMAYTGISMLEGDKLNAFYRYLTELYGRPVYTHELIALDIEHKSKPDFLKLCYEEDPEQKKGKWMKNDNGTYSCDKCHSWIPNEQHYYARYCIYCGIKMEEGD